MVDNISTGNVIQLRPRGKSTEQTQQKENQEKELTLSERSVQMLERMDKTLGSVSASMMNQTSIMQETLKFHRDALAAQRQEKMRGFDQPGGGGKGGGGGWQEAPSMKPDSGQMKKWLDYLIESTKTGTHSFLGALGGAIGGVRFAPAIIAGVTMAVAPTLGAFVGDLAKELIAQTGTVDRSVLDSFDQSFVRGGTMGVLGMLFGKKFAALFAVGGAVSPMFDSTLQTIFDRDGDGIMSAFGYEFGPDKLGAISSAVGAGLAVALTSSKTRNLIGGAVSATFSTIGWKASVFGAVAGLAYMFGDEIRGGLESMGAEESTADFWTTALQVGSFAAMFVPGGLLAKAIIGLAVGIGGSLIDWYNKATTEADAYVNDKFSKFSLVESKARMGHILTEEDLNVIKEARQVAGTVVSSEGSWLPGAPDAAEVEEARKVRARAIELLEQSNFGTELPANAAVARAGLAGQHAQQEIDNFIMEYLPSGGNANDVLSNNDISNLIESSMESLAGRGVSGITPEELGAIIAEAGYGTIVHHDNNMERIMQAIHAADLDELEKKFFKRSKIITGPNEAEMVPVENGGKLNTTIDAVETKAEEAAKSGGTTVIAPTGGTNVTTATTQVGGSTTTVNNTTVVGGSDLDPGYPRHFGQ